MAELIVAVAAAVLISAMCSLFEAVLYSVPVGHIESLANADRKAGRILQRLRENVDRPIAAILSLNTIANTACAAVAGAAAATVFGQAGVGRCSAAFTLAGVMFSEVIPKTAGVVYNRPLALVVAPPLALLVWLFRPLIWLCGMVTRVVSQGREPEHVSEEEILGLARMGQQTGALESDQAAVIANILTLQDKSVRDIMTPRTVVFALPASTTLEELRTRGTFEHSRIPVYDKNPDDVVGIVLGREVLAAMAGGSGEARLEEMMRPVDFVAESVGLDRLLRMFMEKRQHLLIVLDEFGGLAGVVTLEDVIEEILGQEIVDEFDRVADLRELARRRRERTLDA
ncbi:MAG: hemolysin family protein [Gemmatimonadetes bacterium]|nr:hemolysin family protein [Gemmatimonadota bacterium]